MGPGTDDDGGALDAGFDAGSHPDASSEDSGSIDAGAIDAGTDDSGASDSGVSDSGVRDSGMNDAGANDSGFVDAGFIDAGTSSCAPFFEDAPSSNLSPLTHDLLRQQLDIMAVSWDPTAAGWANLFLSDPANTESMLRGFFYNYFITTAHPLTEPLLNYLGYPVFSWFDASVNRKLQRALAPVLWQRARELLTAAGTDLSAALESDGGTRPTLFGTYRFFDDFGRLGIMSDTERTKMSTSFGALLVNCAPGKLRAQALNVTTERYVASLRAQVWMAYRDTTPLDVPAKNAFASALGLTGPTLNLWSTHNTVLSDNRGFSVAQTTAIQSLLDVIPSSVLDLRHVTQNEYIGNVAPRSVWFRNIGGVNIFNVAVGAVAENSFPNDVPSTTIDLFTAALAHEANHIVDALYVEKSPVLKARKMALLARAGTVDAQFLRSQVGGAFFQNAPQEFVASISNEWFTDTSRTLDLAVLRFNAGFKEPLNQFLFFAEIYSEGTLTTRFYRVDAQSNVTSFAVTVERDGLARINRISWNGKVYHITLDSSGYATALLVQ